MSDAIYFSRKNDNYGIFSNFSKCNIIYEGLSYNSVEAAFQSAKTLNMEDRKRFTTMNPSLAKREGRQLHLRKDWEEVKYSIMKELIQLRFNSDSKFRDTLISTGSKLIVENTTGWHDNIWGKCLCNRCFYKTGQNLLGKALMEVRNEYLYSVYLNMCENK